MWLCLSSNRITIRVPHTHHTGRDRGELESLPGCPSQQVVARLLKEVCSELSLHFRQQKLQGFL